MRLSIIIPVLNEADGIVRLLSSLQNARSAGHEIVIADGGSEDGTLKRASPLADIIVKCPRGRALQMNAGAANATGDVLFFLHADSVLPADFLKTIGKAVNRGRWGRFDIRLDGDRFMLRAVEWLMNHRSRWTGISTGDQGLFVERKLFEAVGKFPAIALMEDIAITKKLCAVEAPICLRERITTSSRRWENNGIWRTIWLMWRLRFAYWRGADPKDLARTYYPNSARG